MEIKGKHVLVTGGAIRVGAAIVRRFADAGAKVTVHCRSSAEAAEKLISALPGSGHSFLTMDFSRGTAAASELWEMLSSPVDILINNASCYRLPEEKASEYEPVNYLAPLELMRRFSEQNITEGAVVNMLDQALLNAEPDEEIHYLESRRKLADATRNFALRFAPRNLRFNAVAPGPVIPPKGLESSKMTKTLARVPLGRAVNIDDLTDAILFLARSSSITGAILPVDCGRSLQK